jgi:hypothetical protein
MARPHIVIVGADLGGLQSGTRLITGPGSH